MNYNKSIHNFKKNVLTLMIIVFSTSSLFVITRMDTAFFFMFLFFVFFLLVIVHIRKRISKKIILINSILSLLTAINMVINVDFSAINFAFIILPWFGLLIYQSIERLSFAYGYCNCMCFLGAYSLIAHYGFMFIFPRLVSVFPIVYNSAGFPAHDFFLAFRYVGIISKNTGIFREMGVYTVYLNFALYLMLFEAKDIKHKWFKICVLAITVLSTLSTPGIIAMGLIAFSGVVEMLKTKKINNVVLVSTYVGIIVFVGMIIVIRFPIIASYLQLSLAKLTQKGSSFYGRIGSEIACLKVWGNSPVLGVGYQKSVQLANSYYDYTEILHITSSIGALAAMYGGIYVFVLFRYPLATMFKKKINGLSKVMIILAILLLIECQYMILDSLFWVFLYYFMEETGQ